MSAAIQVEALWNGIRDEDGEALAGGLVYTYEAGTTTAKAVYTDRAKTTEAANPVVLDSLGQAKVYADGAYKFVVKTAADETVVTYDDLYYGVGDNSLIWGGTAGGSADALTLTPATPITEYADGMTIAFMAAAANLTAAPTVAVSGLAAKEIRHRLVGGTLYAGALQNGQLCLMVYSSANGAFYLLNPKYAAQADIRLQPEQALQWLNSSGALKNLISSDGSDRLVLNDANEAGLFIQRGGSLAWVFGDGYFRSASNNSRDLGDATYRFRCVYTYQVSAGGTDLTLATTGANQVVIAPNGNTTLEIDDGMVNFAKSTTRSGTGSTLRFIDVKIAGVTKYIPYYASVA